jgi:Chromo (CHRromatin Organisation MOdifier) domain
VCARSRFIERPPLHKRLGPYEVIEKIRSAVYRIKLPRSMRLHNVFHACLLEPHKKDTIPGRHQPPPPPVKINDSYELEVQEILDSRIRRKQLQYLIRWRGKTPDCNSWEPADNVANAQRLARKFHKRYPTRPAPVSLQQRRSAEVARRSTSGRGSTVMGTP